MLPDKTGSTKATAPPEETSVPAWIYPYRAGVIGGGLGGLAMIGVAALYGLLSGVGLWLPVNLIGATIVRDLQGASLQQLTAFHGAALIAGLALHMGLAIFLGLIFALLLPTFPGSPILWSLLVSPLLWALASVLILPLLNPVMAQHVEHTSFFVAHVVYGLVLGWWIAHTPKVHA